MRLKASPVLRLAFCISLALYSNLIQFVSIRIDTATQLKRLYLTKLTYQCGCHMRHDWIFDVLTDLRSYAEKNNLPAIAQQADVARQELTEKTKSEQAGEDQSQS